MRALRKLLDASEWTLVAVCIAAFVAMFCLGLASVFFRFVVQSSLAFPDELLRYLFVWVVALGAAVVYRRNMHAAIGAFVTVLPAVWRKGALILASLANLAFFVIVLVSGFRLTLRAWPQISPALEVSMAWVYAALPASMLFLLVYAVELLLWQIATPAENLQADGR